MAPPMTEADLKQFLAQLRKALAEAKARGAPDQERAALFDEMTAEFLAKHDRLPDHLKPKN
ncbi:hypothetical protein [Bradyrhizobium sp. Leo121]|uniref:hypothetical protein n=1 Tax=Bradyrhizobium sp. Leo121 TaxID=1571195 RepID=UPI00102A1837|nr:hypothetical protein [Bradyrhizobium sp. Leo121]